jgi:nucleoside-diphosphate-sugar epimerase
VVLARSEAAAAAVKKEGAFIYRGDLLDAQAITEGMQGCDTVFHVAGHLSDWNPYEVFYNSNVVGTRTMLTAAKATGVSTFVAVGASAVVMGRPMSMKNISEDLPLQAVIASQHCSLRQAAEAISIRQSTLSRRLRDLEYRLAPFCFERTNGGTHPTVARLEFFELARRIAGAPSAH